MANISVRTSQIGVLPPRSFARRTGDVSACLIIAPTSCALAVVLAWWAMTLASGTGTPLLAGGLIWAWAAIFMTVGLRAVYVLLRAVVSR